MSLSAFEEFDLKMSNREVTKKELKQETRRQRREAARRLDYYVRALLAYQLPVRDDPNESPTRLD